MMVIRETVYSTGEQLRQRMSGVGLVWCVCLCVFRGHDRSRITQPGLCVYVDCQQLHAARSGPHSCLYYRENRYCFVINERLDKGTLAISKNIITSIKIQVAYQLTKIELFC